MFLGVAYTHWSLKIGRQRIESALGPVAQSLAKFHEANRRCPTDIKELVAGSADALKAVALDAYGESRGKFGGISFSYTEHAFARKDVCMITANSGMFEKYSFDTEKHEWFAWD